MSRDSRHLGLVKQEELFLFNKQQASAALDLVRCYLSSSSDDLPGEQRSILALLVDEAQALHERDD